MSEGHPVRDDVNDKPFSYTMSLINGKWKLHILFWLWHNDILRYNELKRRLSGVTHKVLTNQLKELEADGLIARTEYPQIPPKVEYSLTALGASLMPVLGALCQWGSTHMPPDWELK